MKNKKILFAFFLMLLLIWAVGCTKTEVVSTPDTGPDEVEARIAELEQKLEQQDTVISNQNEQISILQTRIEEIISYDNSYVLLETIDHTTDWKTAMLNSAEIVGEALHLNITYKDFLIDKEGPNGFRLEETAEGTKTLIITEHFPIYLLENPGRYWAAEWKDVVGHNGFLQLYEKDGKVVFIKENYLP